ncbi:hypothetical protein ABPG75_000806 [Micractinium tetrahymenae]
MAQAILDLLLPVDDRDCSFVLELPAEAAAEAGGGEGGGEVEPASKRRRTRGSRGTDAASAAGTSAPGTDRTGEALVGCRIEVYWFGDREWFAGVVESFAKPTPRAAKLKHKVRYDDGEERFENLGNSRWRLVAEPAARREALPACSVVLRQFSSKFRDWAARWAQGGAREYVVQCRDEAEVAGYRHLLDFMHSMGRQLPADADELLQLLMLAREHAVEAAVLACTQALQDQAPSLPAAFVMHLLPALDTGVSGDAGIQAAADKLAAACCDRLSQWLAQGGAPDATEQHLLLQALGPLQDMLNDERRRRLFLKLPFALLRDCILDDAYMNADTETTVLAATLLWAEEQRSRITDSQLAELFSRIRFPDVPAGTLINYHRCFPMLRRFDPDKELLLRAITDPSLWSNMQEAMLADQPDQQTAELAKKCGRWWLPREPPLQGAPAPAEFCFECAAPPANLTSVYSRDFYWAGCWWRVRLKQGTAQAVNFHVFPAVSRERFLPEAGAPGHSLHRIRVKYALYLSRGAHEDCQARGTAKFAPTKGGGPGSSAVKDLAAQGSPPLSWEALWAEGSPYCRDGVVRGRVTLRLPD